MNRDQQALVANYVDPAVVDLFKTLGVVRVQEASMHLGDLAKEYQTNSQSFGGIGAVPALRARIGEGQPIGRMPPQPPPEQQGIGQLPQPPQPPDDMHLLRRWFLNDED
jgi:hypothetical protein